MLDGEGGALELRQTRELTVQEWREFMRVLRKQASQSATGKWLIAAGLVWWLVAAWLALSIVAAVHFLRPVAPDLAWQLAIVAVAFCVVLFGNGRLSDFIRAKRQLRGDTDTIFLIEPDGFRARSPLFEVKGCWLGIPALVERDQYLVVMLTESIASIIVKSAFDGQDVSAFCAELQRRWKTARQSEP